MADKLVFDASIEGLFVRGLGDRVTPGLRAELKALGIDLMGKLPPAVSKETWYLALGATARHVFPRSTRGQALREVGIVLMKGFEDTFFGRTMAPIVRMLGPRRLIERMPKNMKTSNNFAECVVTQVSPTEYTLDVSDVGDAPEVFEGSIEELTRWAGAKNIEVKFTFEKPPAAKFWIRWSE